MKYIYFALLLSLFTYSCGILEHKSYQPYESRNTQPTRVVAPLTEQAGLQTRYYKFETGQKYIRSVDRYYYGVQTEMQNQLGKYNVKKYINVEQYNKYAKASFFQPNVYTIPNEVKNQAIAMFKPLIDTLFELTTSNTSFHAEIFVLGYTDEDNIPVNESIYNDLLKLSKKPYFQNNDYYNVLSYYRAYNVAQLLNDLLKNKEQAFRSYTKASIDIFAEGRGIEFPDAKRNYELIDAKRRITKLYWKIYIQ